MNAHPFLATLLVLAVAVTGCSADAAPDEVHTPVTLPSDRWGEAEVGFSGSGASVAVLGDELIRSSSAQLRRRLAGFAVMIAAIEGEGFSGGIRSDKGEGEDMLAIASRYGAKHPSRVVIALGHHDATPESEEDVEDVLGAVDQLIAYFPDACIIAVNVVTDPEVDGFRTDLAEQINERLADRADRVADWNRLVRDDPTYVEDDGVTPTRSGSERLGRSIMLALERCT